MWIRQTTDEDESCIYEYRKDDIRVVAEYGGWHSVYNKSVWEVRVWSDAVSFKTTVYLPGCRGDVRRPPDDLGGSLVAVCLSLRTALVPHRGSP